MIYTAPRFLASSLYIPWNNTTIKPVTLLNQSLIWENADFVLILTVTGSFRDPRCVFERPHENAMGGGGGRGGEEKGGEEKGGEGESERARP